MMDQLAFKPLAPKEGTTKAAVLNMLQHYQHGLCRQDFADNHVYEVSARVGELRALGWVITTRICVRHPHRSRILEYQLDRT